MLVINHILLFFGLGPNSGATPVPGSIDTSKVEGSGSGSSFGGGISGPGGGGGGAG